MLTWGDPAAPKLFLLHGWMDVGASFQFLVDAFARDWYVIAPDLRGFGRSEWQPQGYWFADYVADLEALVDAFAPGETVDLVGHSLGGNVVMIYAGVRPARVRRVVSLDGFGIPAEDADARARRSLPKWLDALAAPPAFAPYANLDAVADRLQKNNPRLPRDKAAVPRRRTGRRRRADGQRAPASPIRGTSCRFRRSTGSRRRSPSGARSPRRRCGSRRRIRPSPSGSTIIREGEAGADGLDGVRRRMAHIRDARLVVDARRRAHAASRSARGRRGGDRAVLSRRAPAAA